MSELGAQSGARAYSALASEYYDAARHPTCAAFREASAQLLEKMLLDVARANDAVEVGAGDSLLAAVLTERGLPIKGLLLTDDSPEMLEHSRLWHARGASLAVASADRLPVDDASVALVVASLADPYDDAAFWGEVRRVLKPGGRALVTTPSWTWALRFRGTTGPHDHARFVLRTGDVLDVPSIVRRIEDEQLLIGNCGLTTLDCRSVDRSRLATSAPKLDVLGPTDPVVTGYLVKG